MSCGSLVTFMNRTALFSSSSDRWATPAALYDALNCEFKFDLDPCPLDGTTDGLAPLFSNWRGRWVFCNPPYGPGIRNWKLRGLEARLAVFLLPARTDTNWFHELALPFACEIRFLRGRLRFGDARAGAPFPSLLVVFQAREAAGGMQATLPFIEVEYDRAQRSPL